MNWKRMWKEAVVDYNKPTIQCLTGELGKTMKTSVWIGGLQGEI
jgi:hypothetical protein